ncbi:MAG: ribonuclease P protein component [Chitinophagaceae bacterium]
MQQRTRYTLGRNERLKSRKQIEFLFSKGQSFHSSPFKVYYSAVPVTDKRRQMQFAVGVGTRYFKHAVDRNRVKRLIREAYRLQRQELQQLMELKELQLTMFFIFTGKAVPDFEITKEKVKAAIEKLIAGFQ